MATTLLSPHLAIFVCVALVTALIALIAQTIYWLMCMAYAISLVINLVITLLTQRIDPPKPFTDIDGKPLAVKNWIDSWNAVDGG